MKKLNIGFGGVRKVGYDNLDRKPELNPDILADARDMHMIPDGSYGEVFSYGFIEHVEPKDIPKVLSEMFRILEDGGHLRIGTVDFAVVLERYLEKGLPPLDTWIHDAIYGPHYSHRAVLDERALGVYLSKAGFRGIVRFPLSYGILYMEAWK